MAKIDDDFWPASLAHLIKPYLSDSSQYVTIGEISSEPLNNFPGTRLLYTAMVPVDEADECLARPGGIGHGISHLKGQLVLRSCWWSPIGGILGRVASPRSQTVSVAGRIVAGYTIDIFCCRSPVFCSITDFPREFFQI